MDNKPAVVDELSQIVDSSPPLTLAKKKLTPTGHHPLMALNRCLCGELQIQLQTDSLRRTVNKCTTDQEEEVEEGVHCDK